MVVTFTLSQHCGGHMDIVPWTFFLWSDVLHSSGYSSLRIHRYITGTSMEGDASFVQLVASERSQAVSYVVVSSMTVLAFDYCLTLADEIELMWNSKFNAIKILYFLSRYLAFIDVALSVLASVVPHLPQHNCVVINDVISWFTILGIGIAEVILILRTFALWARDRRVLYGLSLLFAVFYIPSLVITGIFLHLIKLAPLPYETFPGCSLQAGSPIIFINFVTLIVFETVIVGMTSYRWFKNFRSSSSTLVSTLYSDGIVFYLCLACISFANVFVLSLGPIEYQDLITTFQRVMHSVLSCRILLHARAVNRLMLNALSLPPMQFVKPVLLTAPHLLAVQNRETDVTAVDRDSKVSASVLPDGKAFDGGKMCKVSSDRWNFKGDNAEHLVGSSVINHVNLSSTE